MPGLSRSLEGGYPPEWPWVAWLVKCAAGWRCEHCDRALPPGGRGDQVLTVHHIDGDVSNLMSWDLVALCLACHGWAARELALDQVDDVEQLSLAPADPPAWLLERRRDRQRFPRRRADEALRATQRLGVADGRPGSLAAPDPAAVGASQRLCACGCGQAIPAAKPGQQRYVDRAHQQRAHRERHGDQLSLLVSPKPRRP